MVTKHIRRWALRREIAAAERMLERLGNSTAAAPLRAMIENQVAAAKARLAALEA